MDDWIVLSNTSHPKFDELCKLPNFYQWGLGGLDPLQGRSQALDLTLLPQGPKRELLGLLAQIPKISVISDLGAHVPGPWFQEFPCLIGAVNLSFFSPTGHFEYYGPIGQTATSLGEALSLTPVEVTHLPLGFPLAQTLSMIFTEAHLALEEGLARDTDIDQALKTALNYPLGPFEWESKGSPQARTNLLEELWNHTGGPRYCIPSKALGRERESTQKT